MSRPTRDQFPPGQDGYRAWRAALGEDLDPRPNDPAKWAGVPGWTPEGGWQRPLHELLPGRLPQGLYTGPGGVEAWVYPTDASPPLRVRSSGQVEGAALLDRWLRGLHPQELQRVLPALLVGQEVTLEPLRPGSPFAGAGGRVGSRFALVGDRWRAEVGDQRGEGRRVDALNLLVLSADLALALAPAATSADLRAARAAAAAEPGVVTLVFDPQRNLGGG